ncbi:SRPBCC family protein [Kitasatospora sp. NPDC050543]|uniref:SRPBCC family protein n=1 Tax=Kitasatospora sp. NPDC050543 TaxID=3364054 RepID=UPI0037A95892
MVRIDAPPERIWAALVDVESWPRWTASMTHVRRLEDGPLLLGSTARLKQPGLPAAVWRVTGFELGRSFSWLSAGPGVTTVGGHELERGPAGGMRLTLTLDQSGPLARPVELLLGERARRFLGMEAEGLRRCCEG